LVIKRAVHEQDIPLDYVMKSPNALHVITQFGGHLGFYEGSYWAPRSLTFMDRFLLQFCNALLTLNANGMLESISRRKSFLPSASASDDEEAMADSGRGSEAPLLASF